MLKEKDKQLAIEALGKAPLSSLRQSISALSGQIRRGEAALEQSKAALAVVESLYEGRLALGEIEGSPLEELEKVIAWGQGVSVRHYPLRVEREAKPAQSYDQFKSSRAHEGAACRCETCLKMRGATIAEGLSQPPEKCLNCGCTSELCNCMEDQQ